MADPGSVAAAVDGVTVPSAIIRFPVWRARGRGTRGLTGTLGGAPGATVAVDAVADPTGRPIHSAPAVGAEANGEACRKVSGAMLPG
jgi:hypothetical protein